MPAPYKPAAEGIRLFIRVTPGASRDKVGGLHEASDGAAALSVRVRARPEKGKANTAVIGAVAKALGVPKSDVELTAGAKDRRKTLVIQGDTSVLTRRIDALIDAGE